MTKTEFMDLIAKAAKITGDDLTRYNISYYQCKMVKRFIALAHLVFFFIHFLIPPLGHF
jgi:hypothetical protein